MTSKNPDYAAVLADARAHGLGSPGIDKWEHIVELNPTRGDERPRKDIEHLKARLLRQGGVGFTDPDWLMNDDLSPAYVSGLLDYGDFIMPVSGQTIVTDGEMNMCYENARATARERGVTEMRGFACDEDGWWFPHAWAYSEKTGHIFEGPAVVFVRIAEYFGGPWEPR